MPHNVFSLRYNRMKPEHEERARLLLRMVYRLAMLGIDVHARDAKGDTALVKSAARLDQNLITHIIRIGELLRAGRKFNLNKVLMRRFVH